MFRPVRTLVGLAFVFGCLWAAFSVELGSRTLVQHLDRIGRTPEAQELMEGTRATVDPVLEEAKDRVLGEHVEAPTYIEGAPAPPGGPDDLPGFEERFEPTAPERASTPGRAKLPGRKG